MKHVSEMTKQEAAEALDRIRDGGRIAYRQHEDERFWAELRAKHPDLAARADEAAQAEHRALLKQVVAANEALHVAEASHAALTRRSAKRGVVPS